MNYSDEIKSRLTAREVFEFYGFSVNRGGFCLSPFSDEKTPSCKVYDGQRGIEAVEGAWQLHSSAVLAMDGEANLRPI